MDVFECVLAGTPYDDSIAVFLPFQDRPWADAKLSADGGGN